MLEQIYSWADAQDERCIYWLNGLAGTGKSTIARTVARRLDNRSSLGASFFFARGGGDVGHAGRFATSIAFQLASNVPATRQHILDVAKEFPHISNLSLRDQWRHLVLKPLSASAVNIDTTSIVLIIDALDECDGDDDVGKIIELLAEARDLNRLRLRIFLTSRPGVPIRHGFGRMSNALLRRYVLHHISPDIVDADIELFLTQHLMVIGQQQYLPADWPGPGMIAKMTKRASGLFIWAATACKFIGQGRRFAERRLESIMRYDSGGPVGPETHLDSIYLTVLRDSVSPDYTTEEKEEHYKTLRLVLGTLAVLERPLSMRALGGLLDIGKEYGGIESIVQDLHAILDIPEHKNRTPRLHHPSLRDFLLDHSRCTDAEFFIDEAHAHGALASRCIELMTRFFQQYRELSPTYGTAMTQSDDEPPMTPAIHHYDISKVTADKMREIAILEFYQNTHAKSMSINPSEHQKNYQELYGKLDSFDDPPEPALIPMELVYACRHWLHHVVQTGTEDIVRTQAGTFTKEYIDEQVIFRL